MEPQKPDNFPGPGPDVKEKQRVAKERSAQRVRSWTVQNEIRNVLGRVFAAAARRILDFANSREVRAQQKAVSVAARMRENSECDERAQVPQWDRGNLCVEEFR